MTQKSLHIDDNLDWFDPDADKLSEECGVFGIPGNEEAAVITALGLHALQHRGQEGCGIATYDGKLFHNERHLGLVRSLIANAGMFCSGE